MALFTKEAAQDNLAYLKMGIYGDPGAGKTYTATQIAKGLALLIGSKNGGKKPAVFMLDTERGSAWVRRHFEKAEIEFFPLLTRSFKDLKEAVSEAEAKHAILIADSMTHFWEEIRNGYIEAKRKRLRNEYAKLELPDWNHIKPEWATFTTAFLNSNAHIILCGRAASVYEFQEREDDGKKEMITAGTRMAAEKGMGYEPSLLVEMTQRQVTGRKKAKTLIRIATVLKDRSDILDGLVFEDPTFQNFMPHIEMLDLGGAKSAGIDTTRTSEGLFPTEGESRDPRAARRRVALGDIQDLLVLHVPGQAAADKQKKIGLLRKHFDAGWAEMEELMKLEDLQQGLKSLRDELEPQPKVQLPTGKLEDIGDEIPHADLKLDAQAADGTPEKQPDIKPDTAAAARAENTAESSAKPAENSAPQPDKKPDIDEATQEPAAIVNFRAQMEKCHNPTLINSLYKKWAKTYAICSPEVQAQFDRIRDEALARAKAATVAA